MWCVGAPAAAACRRQRAHPSGCSAPAMAAGTQSLYCFLLNLVPPTLPVCVQTSEKEMLRKELQTAAAGAVDATVSSASEEIIYKIDIPANRYDMLCLEGIARALNIFRGRQAPPTFRLADMAGACRARARALPRRARRGHCSPWCCQAYNTQSLPAVAAAEGAKEQCRWFADCWRHIARPPPPLPTPTCCRWSPYCRQAAAAAGDQAGDSAGAALCGVRGAAGGAV
jgi:hypothetical protein